MMTHPGGNPEPAAVKIAPLDAMAALAFLDREEARTLAALCVEKRFAADETVMAEGDPADWMAFVLAGKVAVKKSSLFPGRYTLLAELEPGGMVGEGGLVSGGERDLVVAAVTETRLLVLSRANFLRLCQEDQALALKLLTRIITVMRHRLHSAANRLSWIL
ncbi:cyclic nucleotide-binding domain-containing protein [Desulfurivibrio sp. D14AmB]|uniref:cyclic nucleotide-binding domain-containing protein n=1 Tax=Desulfurivibrio sp. D14AmB TaxID=3374370 RepID=UPI00376EBB61